MNKEIVAQGHPEKQFKSWSVWFQSHGLSITLFFTTELQGKLYKIKGHKTPISSSSLIFIIYVLWCIIVWLFKKLYVSLRIPAVKWDSD